MVRKAQTSKPIDRLLNEDAEGFATVDDLIPTPEETQARHVDIDMENGKKVRVRPLSRAEGLRFKNKKMQVAVFEQQLIATAIVIPTMTMKQVAAWQEGDVAGLGNIELVTNTIMRISGMTKEGPKSTL